MKFGKVDSVQGVDLSIPPDHVDTARVLAAGDGKPRIHVGCAKWNKADLKNFYPKGTKDELIYYASQFNSIELNATFYRQFPPAQFTKWKEKTPEEFMFFPKVPQTISHWGRLKEVQREVDIYTDAARHLDEKLGMVFLQMHNNFAPKDLDRVIAFAEAWPKDVPLAIEFRHTDWYNDETVSMRLYELLEEHRITNIITDTAGRRDLVHMRLTSPTAFIRWVGANDPTDRTRLDEWVVRLKEWMDQGIENIYFFVHQNHELESPLLAAYFIRQLNEKAGTKLQVPKTLDDSPELF